MNLNFFSVNSKFKKILLLFTIFISCKKGILENFYFEYYDLEGKAEYLNERGEIGLIYPIKDTLKAEEKFKKFIFLDETKILKRKENLLYELKKVKFYFQDIVVDEFIVPFLDILPIEGEKINFNFSKKYLMGSDTLIYKFDRLIRIEKEEENFTAYLFDTEISIFENNITIKKDSFSLTLEAQKLPKTIKKGGKTWKRKN
ncbi:MAG: hypothetical protein ABIN15_01835 [candidate division WOR-3 bacterium]